MSDKRTVIYIMSDVRSGSTLLENILSKSEESVSVGELRLLKSHIFRNGPGIRWNWNCSCGKPIAECEFWSSIIQGLSTSSQEFNTSLQWNYRSKKMFAGSLFSPVLKKTLLQLNNRQINKNTVATNINIYRKIFEQSGKQYIVDSSKDPAQAYITYLNKPEDFEVKIINLKRDLRAIAASKSKWRHANKQEQKPLNKLLTNSLYYKKICSVIANLVPSENVLTITYEDLAVNTQQQLDFIVKKFGMKSFESPTTMCVENDHTIAGTPQRFTKKPIVYDDSWKLIYDKKPVLSVLGKIMNTI